MAENSENNFEVTVAAGPEPDGILCEYSGPHSFDEANDLKSFMNVKSKATKMKEIRNKK